jgi:hypothetical protein
MEEKVMLKRNERKKSFNQCNKAYMSSYDWNYMVLDLVDYIESNLSSAAISRGGSVDEWKYSKEFCLEKGLNWRAIKKMIECTVCQVFDCEADLANYEEFKALTKEDCQIASSTKNDDSQVTATPIKGDHKCLPMAVIDYSEILENLYDK